MKCVRARRARLRKPKRRGTRWHIWSSCCDLWLALAGVSWLARLCFLFSYVSRVNILTDRVKCRTNPINVGFTSIVLDGILFPRVNMRKSCQVQSQSRNCELRPGCGVWYFIGCNIGLHLSCHLTGAALLQYARKCNCLPVFGGV